MLVHKLRLCKEVAKWVRCAASTYAASKGSGMPNEYHGYHTELLDEPLS